MALTKHEVAEAALTTLRCTDYSNFAYETYGDLTQETWVQVIFILIYVAIFLAGIIGNLCVIISVARKAALQSVRNLFIVSLSCSDIVVCLTSLPITPITIMKKNWIFGLPMCYVFPLLQCMSTIISTFTLMAIAIDRFVLIIYPTKQPLQKRHAVPMILAIWTLAVSISIPMLLHYNLYKIPYEQKVNSTIWYCGYFCDERWPSDQARKLYGGTVLLLQFIIPLIVITVCYGSIFLRVGKGMALRQRTDQSLLPNNGTAQSEAIVSRQKAALKRRQRTNRMLISMVGVFIACWFFQVLMNVLRDFSALPPLIASQPYFFSLLVHCLAMSSTLWNPILYAWLNESFRTAFVEILPCVRVFCCTKKPQAKDFSRYRMDSVAE